MGPEMKNFQYNLKIDLQTLIKISKKQTCVLSHKILLKLAGNPARCNQVYVFIQEQTGYYLRTAVPIMQNVFIFIPVMAKKNFQNSNVYLILQ